MMLRISPGSRDKVGPTGITQNEVLSFILKPDWFNSEVLSYFMSLMSHKLQCRLCILLDGWCYR